MDIHTFSSGFETRFGEMGYLKTCQKKQSVCSLCVMGYVRHGYGLR